MVRKNVCMLALAILGLLGCSKSDDKGTKGPETKPEAVSQPAAAPAKPTEGAVAEVNGLPITQDEFLRYLEPYPPRMKESPQGREHVLQALVDQILLEAEAKRLGLDKDPEFLRKIDSYRRNLLNNMLLDAINKDGFEVSEEDARKYFDENPQEFNRPARVQARHILLASEAEAKNVLAKIKKGLAFEQAAKEFSKDTATQERGGDLGLFTREQRPDIADTIFGLKTPGKMSGPVKTNRGYHLFQLVSITQEEKDTWDKVKANLVSRLKARKRQETREGLLAKLRESSQINVDKKALESLQVATTGSGDTSPQQ